MDIRILPSNIANMIAAGEVVQRPASVVKELMENAVDAGASQVTVVITDAGRTLIQVIDDGCGMAPDEAVLCFERHATSKIATAEDLGKIMTFGFRGEALASIAAVSEVTLKTRQAGQDMGCQVEFADSKHLASVEAACPVGSNFAVRNLFYNVPARRKFLKSDNVEFKHIVEEFSRVALTRPDMGFTLIHNGRDVYVLKPAKSLKFRILDLMGKQVADDLVPVEVETTVVRVEGFVGRPDSARKTLGNQFFFVNGRFFRSPYLHKAVMNAYENLIPQGVTPAYFLYLDIDPSAIDVNIHPTKTEIKFEDDSVVFQILFACVKEALGTASFGASIDFETKDVPEMPVFGSSFREFRTDFQPPRVDIDETYNPFEPAGSGPKEAAPSGPAAPAHTDYSKYVDKSQDYGKLFDQSALPSNPVLLLQGKYILAQAASGLMVVNIRRARERVLFDRFLAAFTKNAHVSQVSLFPVQVMVGVENRLVFDEHADLLASLGFDITPFGNDTIAVNGVPEGFSTEPVKVEGLMADILLALNEPHAALPEMMQSAMAEKFARIGAARGKGMTSAQEAQRLVDALFSSSNSEFTSSGHRIMTLIPMEEIDKKF